MKLKLYRSIVAVAVLCLCTACATAWAGQGTMTKPTPSTASAKPAKPAKAMPTDAEIADAKSKGMVWVNLNTKVYHKDDAVYGKTKNGQFMTEADAQKSGARMAKSSPVGKKKTAPAQ